MRCKVANAVFASGGHSDVEPAQSTSRTSSFESRVERRKRKSAAYARAMARASLGLTDSELVGRDVEAARVDAIIERLPDGGAALVVSGETGVGKSALLHYARARADALGLRTLTAVGVESEAELAFAGLHQLLYPILGLLEGDDIKDKIFNYEQDLWSY